MGTFNHHEAWHEINKQCDMGIKKESERQMDLLINDLEETCLCIMSAGIPANMISVSRPKMAFDDGIFSYSLQSEISIIGAL